MSQRRKAAAKNRPLEIYAPVFAALGDEMRLRLIGALCMGGAMSITHLTSGMDISRQAVTKHLGVLAAAGWVRGVKVGRERLWEFEPAQLDEARRSLELIGRQWDHALAKLKLAVESDPS
jgi:DNA-binding transcriptional ArsR family regulator